eukprot:m.266697 g.266697  ORF g.266697 m.266697 type:complete len:455 (+) comp26768_c0_seq10:62-1426(+)
MSTEHPIEAAAHAAACALGGTVSAHRVAMFQRCGLTRDSLLESGFIPAHVLCSNSAITTLMLNYNDLGDGFIADLVATMETERPEWFALRQLYLINTGLTLGNSTFATLLSMATLRLTHLDLSSNIVGAEVGNLCDALGSCDDLVCLKLCSCGLLSGVVARLVGALDLGGDGTLEELYLDYNAVGDGGAVALAEALRTNCALHTLSLRQAGVDERGGVALGDAWRYASNLTHLFVTDNPLGDVAVQALINAVAFCEEKQLDLEDEHGEAMSDEMHTRLVGVGSLTPEARRFLELCTDAWCSAGKDLADESVLTFWTELGFIPEASDEMVGALGRLSQDDIDTMVSSFSVEVLDAVLRSGADGVASEDILRAAGMARRSVVATEITRMDLSPPTTLRCLCRRAMRKSLGSTVIKTLLCGDAGFPAVVRVFLFYGQDLAIEGTLATHYRLVKATGV